MVLIEEASPQHIGSFFFKNSFARFRFCFLHENPQKTIFFFFNFFSTAVVRGRFSFPFFFRVDYVYIRIDTSPTFRNRNFILATFICANYIHPVCTHQLLYSELSTHLSGDKH